MNADQFSQQEKWRNHSFLQGGSEDPRKEGEVEIEILAFRIAREGEGLAREEAIIKWKDWLIFREKEGRWGLPQEWVSEVVESPGLNLKAREGLVENPQGT